jgi:hypothetical protein
LPGFVALGLALVLPPLLVLALFGRRASLSRCLLLVALVAFVIDVLGQVWFRRTYHLKYLVYVPEYFFSF